LAYLVEEIEICENINKRKKKEADIEKIIYEKNK